MYKHLLVPVDGSRLSAKAVREATALARLCGARLTLLHTTPDYPDAVTLETVQAGTCMAPDQYRLRARRRADKVLARAAEEPVAAGVRADTFSELNDHPYEAIIQAAARRKCDAIVMASHGRRGIAGFILGSETQKVLTHSKIPVLVVR